MNVAPLKGSEGAEDAARFALDVRSLLLYAHTTALPNPFGQLIGFGGPPFAVSLRSTPKPAAKDFIFALGTIANLGQLIASEVVMLFDPVPPNAAVPAELSHSAIVQDVVGEVAIALVQQGGLPWSDQADLFLKAQVIVERLVLQTLYLPPELREHATQLLSCDIEAQALPILASINARRRESNKAPGGFWKDPWILSELVRIRLQGAGRLRLSDMVAVRNDDSFTVFRNDMRDAIDHSATALARDDLDEAQEIIAEEMRAAARRLSLQTGKSKFLDATLGDAISWCLGAAIGGALAGWVGAAIGLIGKGLTEVTRSRLTKSDEALHAHYVALGSPPNDVNATRASLRQRLLDTWEKA